MKHFVVIINEIEEGEVVAIRDYVIIAKSRYHAWEVANQKVFGETLFQTPKLIYIINT